MTDGKRIQQDSKIVRDNEVIFSEADGEMVMMSLERGEYYGLNPIGSRIWSLLESPRRDSELCETLLPDYNVSLEQCQQDVLRFLDQLAEKGVIKILAE